LSTCFIKSVRFWVQWISRKTEEYVQPYVV